MEKGWWGTFVQVPRNQGEEEREAKAKFRVLSLARREDGVASNDVKRWEAVCRGLGSKWHSTWMQVGHLGGFDGQLLDLEGDF